MSSVNRKVNGLNKPVALAGVAECDLPIVLHSCYARFEKQDFSHEVPTLKQSLVAEHELVITSPLSNIS